MSKEKFYESCLFYPNSYAEINFIKIQKKKFIHNFTPIPDQNSQIHSDIVNAEIYNDFDSFNHEKKISITSTEKKEESALGVFRKPMKKGNYNIF